MSDEKRIAFVINPNSGPKKKDDIAQIIANHISPSVAYDIILWKDKDGFEEIRQQITSGKYNFVVAVGGDGTVNQVAKSIVNTNIVLGIIPRGSGNGLARSLGIPQNALQALKRIETGTVKIIDNGFINGHYFSCAAGIGFDAHICHLFANSKTRGLLTYISISVQQILSYRAKEYVIETDTQTLKTKAFLIAFANAGQYGNDFYIAPQAKMDDGLLQVVIIKPFNILSACNLLVKVLQKKAHLSKNVLTLTAKKITIKNPDIQFMHFDGEPGNTQNQVEVSINPQSLKIIC